MAEINLNIDSEASAPKFRSLAEAVKNAISEGKLRTGESLPSVSLICEQFNLSRDTVFKAYSLLREQGVVMSHPGKGYFLILQCSTLQSIVVPYNSWLTGASMSEQARRVTDWRRERRWEMLELNHRQQ